MGDTVISLEAMRRPNSTGRGELDEAALLALEARYCSHGDTVHYVDRPKIFERCAGSFLFDAEDRPYLDLQMWYSAVNFGYSNIRLNEALIEQLSRLPAARQSISAS